MSEHLSGTISWVGAILADRSLDPTETLLLIGLADHVDANDECFVGIDRLAEYARISYATAKRRLTQLEVAGRLVRTRQASGTTSATTPSTASLPAGVAR